MSIKDIIVSRRSIRKYKETDIPYDVIVDLIDVAKYAPSAGNIQPWYFIIVKDPDAIEEIARLSEQDFVKQAPVLIVVCSDDKKMEYYFGEDGKKYALQSVAAAIQNILLYAHSKGLGTCWIGKYNEDEIKKILEIPDDISIHAIITVGYPDEIPSSDRKSTFEIVFFEKWGNRLYKPGLFPLKRKLKEILKRLK